VLCAEIVFALVEKEHDERRMGLEFEGCPSDSVSNISPPAKAASLPVVDNELHHPFQVDFGPLKGCAGRQYNATVWVVFAWTRSRLGGTASEENNLVLCTARKTSNVFTISREKDGSTQQLLILCAVSTRVTRVLRHTARHLQCVKQSRIASEFEIVFDKGTVIGIHT